MDQSPWKKKFIWTPVRTITGKMAFLCDVYYRTCSETVYDRMTNITITMRYTEYLLDRDMFQYTLTGKLTGK
jgi:hypothetical protein